MGGAILEKEIDFLIEYFEKYKQEIEEELKNDHNNIFLQGKVKGLQHALIMTRMYNKSDMRHDIDIEIDTPLARCSSKL